MVSEVFVEIGQFRMERSGHFIILLYFHSLRCDMIKVIRTTESYSFIGSWNRFMVSGYFAWGKLDSQ